MPIQIIRNDITKMECDVIVNVANTSLLGGCKVGQAKLTGAYKLPARFVIHTVGPKWRGGNHKEKELLENCYRESLKLAFEHGCKSVAFPLISSGVYGYPKDQALRVAVDVISGFLIEHDMLVYIVVFDKSSFQMGEKLFSDIASYIDDKYVETHFEFNRARRDERGESIILGETRILSDDTCELFPTCAQTPSMPLPLSKKTTLEDMIKQIDESFSQMLLRKIDEKNMTDAECYKKANIDRKLFSKIRKDVNYRPSKTTAIAFAIALELSLDETKDLLMKAGFALSHSNKFDIIIEYFIVSGNYDVFRINEALFAFDQSLLGM